MFDSLLQGNCFKSKGLELALLLHFQGVSDLSLTAETPKIDVKADIQEKEKDNIKEERNIPMKGTRLEVNNEEKMAIKDDEQQDPTYSPTTASCATAALYPCEKCGKYFKNQRSVEVHSKKHLKKEDQTFDCTICSKIVSSKYILATHMKSHNDNASDRALCNICSKSFANKYILKTHIIQEHSEESETTQPLSCNVCLKSCRNKYIFKQHMKIHDANEKRTAMCNICSKLVTKEILKRHMKNMHGENKHVSCSNCGLNYRISSIVKHQRLCKYTDEEREARKAAKARKCDRCGKVLCNIFKLRKHMEICA